MIPLDSLGEWLRARFPRRVSPQWWQALFESVESAVSPLRNVDHSQRLSDLKLGAMAAILAVERHDIDASLGAYWLLRLAAAAVRLNVPVSELPVVLTPDGSAAWALEHVPLPRDEAVVAAQARRRQYLAADESFFAPIGASYESGSQEPDAQASALRGVEKILSALPWIADHLTDPKIRREVRAWLGIEGQL
ncbi:hypothetical protein [Micromonospora sp. WMMD980]|uniref:hypothetical protein n=1 Tax=Micromonospora sp. WMMD980 TaxID=3016088 RepID=UPI002417E853|nr:hypothetical protein [Micromonospora sp. WMMD980]MDG4802351.1 hypothetical protein [Micromonospora sp. WMMD980]